MNRYLPKVVSKIIPFCSSICCSSYCFIVGSIVGQGKEIIIESGFRLLVALIFLHLFGFVIGFVISWFTFKNWKVAKTISIEIGMQNSGLGVVLARENFSSPLVAIPSDFIQFNPFFF